MGGFIVMRIDIMIMMCYSIGQPSSLTNTSSTMKNPRLCTEFEYKIMLEILRQTSGQLKTKGFYIQIITFENRNESCDSISPMGQIDPQSGYLDYIENAENLFRYIFKDAETKKSMFYLIQARLYKASSEVPLALFTVKTSETGIILFSRDPGLGYATVHSSIFDDLKSNENFLDDLSTFLKCVKKIVEIPN
jgi:hypothetical protein